MFVMFPVVEFEIVVVAAEETEIADVDVELVRVSVAVDVAAPVCVIPATDLRFYGDVTSRLTNIVGQQIEPCRQA